MTTRRLRGYLVALLLLAPLGCGSGKNTNPVVDSDASVPRGSGCGATSLPMACDSYVTGPCTLTVAGTARKYFVVLPANYDPNTPTPLVFTWHYFRSTAQNLTSNGFFGIQAAFPNAIYVAGQGLDDGSTDSGVDYGWPNTDGQDVAFAKAMLAWLKANYCVDTGRVFAAGTSYGGSMTNTLGCQMPEVFRAIGVVSGGLYDEPGTCANSPVAAWFTHGDADKSVPFADGLNARDVFLSRNGCSNSNPQSVVVDANTTCTIYGDCATGNYPVVWCPVVGGGHNPPSWAGAEIAKFFSRF